MEEFGQDGSTFVVINDGEVVDYRPSEFDGDRLVDHEAEGQPVTVGGVEAGPDVNPLVD